MCVSNNLTHYIVEYFAILQLFKKFVIFVQLHTYIAIKYVLVHMYVHVDLGMHGWPISFTRL